MSKHDSGTPIASTTGPIAQESVSLSHAEVQKMPVQQQFDGGCLMAPAVAAGGRGGSGHARAAPAPEAAAAPPGMASEGEARPDAGHLDGSQPRAAMAHKPQLGPDLQANIGEHLRAMHHEVLNQKVPDRFVQLLRELAEKEAKRS
jgi:hypothetical protein